MFEILVVVVVGTSIWMGYESAQRKIPIDSKPYGTNNGAIAWFLSGLLIWIATFPYYLVKRNAAVKAPAAPSISVADELQKLAKLREENAITQDDFERAKAKLLS